MTERQPARRFVLPTGAAVALVLVDAAWLGGRFGGDAATSAVDGLALAIAPIAAAVLAGLRARVPADGGTRLGWALLAGSCATFPLGEVVSGFIAAGHDWVTPFPSAADGLFLAGTALGVPAVALLCGRLWVASRLRLVLDGGIVACALLLLSWLTVMHTLAGRAGTSPAGFAVGLTYALGDVVTVVIVLSAVSHSRRLHPAPLMVAAGMVCFAVADGVFLYLATTADYRGANVIDVGWVAGYSLIALAPRLGGRQPVADAPTLARWQMLLPYVPLVAAGGVVLLRMAGRHPIDPFGQVLLAAVIGLVLVRQLMAVAESQSLTAQLISTVRALQRTSAERQIVIEQAPV